MGSTPLYKLPWPELPDVADGPEAFENLAVATEKALSIQPVVSTLLDGYAILQTVPSGGTGNYLTAVNGAFKTTKQGLFTADLTCFMATNGNSGGLVEVLIDGTVARGMLWHTLNRTFGSTGGIAQRWLAPGSHSLAIRVRIDATGLAIDSTFCDWYSTILYF